MSGISHGSSVVSTARMLLLKLMLLTVLASPLQPGTGCSNVGRINAGRSSVGRVGTRVRGARR
eukprot:10323396-Lingulodinium_polyedra.AAC.1